jgi:hypothetical protein
LLNSARPSAVLMRTWKSRGEHAASVVTLSDS